MTKIHESFEQGTVDEMIEKVQEPKGEYVIIIEKNQELNDEKQDLNSLSLDEHYRYYEKIGYQNKEIIKQIAKDRNVSKNEIYQYFIKNK